MKNTIYAILSIVTAGLFISCKSDDDKPGVPRNVELTGSTAVSLTFSWDAVKGADGYKYKFLYMDGNPVEIAGTTDTRISFTGLSFGTRYKFAVQALYGEGASDFSPFIEVSTDGLEFELDLPEWEDDGIARAFPGAEGGGMYTTGGRGGKVYRVTTLEDSHAPGTLRYAVSRNEPRTIVFDVDGIIELNSNLQIKNGNVTIAGQTAPGAGICLKNHSLIVDADNVIIRYIRCRMGDEKSAESDAMEGRWNKNIIIDHCSMSWSTDECASFYANENFTMQWCILSESLRNSAHEKGTHGYGAIWGGVNASYHHNLLAHHDSRNPRFDGYTVYAPHTSSTQLTNEMRSVDYRNCVVYNFSGYPAYGGEGQKMNFEGNYYKWGPGSENGAGISVKEGVTSPNSPKKRQWYYHFSDEEATMSAYIGGNSNRFTPDRSGTLNSDNWSGFFYASPGSEGGYRKLVSPVPVSPGGMAARVTYHTAEKAYEQVLSYAGASLKRDAVDERVTRDTRTGTAAFMTGSKGSINGFIDSPADVGGWPEYEKGEVQKDTDGDGIPDFWEEMFGLNKELPSDGNAYTLDPYRRYTNLEIYLHWLVREITLKQTEGGNYITQ